VYCAGLFDYLTDSVCARLMAVFYDMLAPGGLLLVTNVDRANPIRHWLGDVLDWHLIYRDAADMKALKPDRAGADEATVCADYTGVNLFLEVRKPLA
jgi:extracellular factor (EF) 3-hydroxypalmitic acid methyl ester biosynthesis protein